MNIEQIEVTIGPDGKVRVQTSGFSGDTCLEATQEIETLLGNQIIRREKTAEAYQPEIVKTAEKIKIRH